MIIVKKIDDKRKLLSYEIHKSGHNEKIWFLTEYGVCITDSLLDDPDLLFMYVTILGWL